MDGWTTVKQNILKAAATTHYLKFVDYLKIQADKPWYK